MYNFNGLNGFSLFRSFLEKQGILFMETKPEIKGLLKPVNYKLLSCLDFFFCMKRKRILKKNTLNSGQRNEVQPQSCI